MGEGCVVCMDHDYVGKRRCQITTAIDWMADLIVYAEMLRDGGQKDQFDPIVALMYEARSRMIIARGE